MKTNKTTQKKDNDIMKKEDVQKMYIKFCHICTISENLKVCGSCKFSEGLKNKVVLPWQEIIRRLEYHQINQPTKNGYYIAKGYKKMIKKITRSEYMRNSSKLHNEYYSQFVTESTIDFINNRVGIDKLKKSTCKHFNDIVSHSNGGAGSWVWDFTPINLELARELGEIYPRGLGSPSTHTCIGKAAARMILNEEN